MAEVQLTADAKEDLRDLDGAARGLVVKKLRVLQDQPELRGKPLGSKGAGNLTTFRSIVVGNRDYRIVYRVNRDGTVCVVSVIAARCDDEVYALALARLQTATTELAGELTEVLNLAFGRNT